MAESEDPRLPGGPEAAPRPASEKPKRTNHTLD